MRYGRTYSHLRAANLEGDDRLADRRGSRGDGAEPLRRAQCLEIERDDCGCIVVQQVFEAVRHLDVSLVASRHELGEPDAARGAAREQRAQNPAALRDDGNLTSRKL